MLVKAPEEPEYLQWLAAETRTLHEPAAPLYGVRYEVTDAQVTLAPAQGAEDNFASTAPGRDGRLGRSGTAVWLRTPV